MWRLSKRSMPALAAFTLLASARLDGQSQTPTHPAAGSVRSRSDETLEWWNQIGNKLIAMAKDLPEDKYDFKVQKDERPLAPAHTGATSSTSGYGKRFTRRAMSTK